MRQSDYGAFRDVGPPRASINQRRCIVKKRISLTVAVLGLAASCGALAQSDWRMPWGDQFWGYAGASAGESKFRRDCGSVVFNCDQKDTAWKVYAGGSFNPVLGLELGYTDFGRMRAFGGDQEARAGNLSLTAGVPLGDRFSVFGKGGAVYSRTEVTAAPTASVATGQKSGWGTTWGLGAAVSLTRSLQARVDWDRYKLDFAGGDRDVDLLSAGLQLRF
jgi:opacity protein-like surface antigen